MDSIVYGGPNPDIGSSRQVYARKTKALDAYRSGLWALVRNRRYTLLLRIWKRRRPIRKSKGGKLATNAFDHWWALHHRLRKIVYLGT